jgi:hypothetical protein
MNRAVVTFAAGLLVLAGGTAVLNAQSDDAPGGAALAAWSDAGQPDSLEAAQRATVSYYTVLGVQLQPRVSATTFAYDFNGCVHLTAGTDNRLMFPLLIPDGSEVKYLRIYYNDTNASTDLAAWLTRYDPGQDSTDLTSVISSGSAGFGTALSDELFEVFDSSLNYSLVVGTNTTDSTVQICGVRITYNAP